MFYVSGVRIDFVSVWSNEFPPISESNTFLGDHAIFAFREQSSIGIICQNLLSQHKKPRIGHRRFNRGAASCKDYHHQPPQTHAARPGERPKAAGASGSRLRNIGLVAHINAGKTTTTERILYHAGSTETVGDVDTGNTITDYLVQERDRGITITSAAVSFTWNQHHVNLIDTPGHVDFTIEVERSLSVLDGAVTILDASAGVEAQTITVWNQAAKYNLPNIIFLNKYDKPQADLKMCMHDLKTNLDISAALIQLPVKISQHDANAGPSSSSLSILDIIGRTYISWSQPEQNNGSRFTIEPLADSKLDIKYFETLEEERERLINFLTDVDDKFANHVIECEKISHVSRDMLIGALRRATLNCQLSPVLVGSSFKYIGVQQLMDAIVDYLPSPVERESQIRAQLGNIGIQEQPQVSSKDENCAFIFKIMHDKRLGPLSYLRVCNGSIAKLQRVKNLESGKLEQVKKVYRMFADELKEIEQPVFKDDIVAVTGLTESKTSDIIVDQGFRPPAESEHQIVEKHSMGSLETPFRLLNHHIIVPQITRMEPVYFCSIESRKASQQIKLESALACLSREDPSFTFEVDEAGITTIRGMGKLHLEIIRDRIESEHGIDSLLGPLQISYRETISGAANEELSVSKLINGAKNLVTIKLYVRSKPKSGLWLGKMLRLETGSENSLGRLRNDHKKAIENGLVSAMSHGPTMGFPMIDCDILLQDFQANGRCSLPVIASTASQCLTNAILRCSPVLLEPIMLLEVVAPNKYNGLILSDISARRGVALGTTARLNGSIVIKSHTPLATLADYSEFLRINTSGRGCFSMELYSYNAMSEADMQSVARL